MNQRLQKIAISGLRWTVGLVVLLEACHFAFSASAIHHFAQTGLPPWIRPALAGSEIIAALLFLVPAATVAGGYLLLAIFAIAVSLHFLRGEFDVGALIVYGMAVIVCMTHGDKEAVEVSHDR